MAQKPMLRAEVGMRVRCANKAIGEESAASREPTQECPRTPGSPHPTSTMELDRRQKKLDWALNAARLLPRIVPQRCGRL